MPVFPGAAYMTMAIEAMRQLSLERPDSPEISKYVLKDVSFVSALVIPDSPKETVEVQMTVRSAANSHEKAASEWKEFRVTSVSSDGANVVEHCRGLIMTELSTSASDESDAAREDGFVVAERMRHLEALRGTCAEEVDCPSLYSDLTSKGNYYGPNFACVKKLQLDGDVNAFGTVVVPDVADCMPSKFMQPHVIHPTALDSLLHASFPLFGKKRTGQSVMASGIGELTLSSNIGNAPHTMFMATTTLQRAGLRSAAADISVFQTDERGEAECVMHITEAEFFATGSAKDEEAENGRDVSYHMKWDIDSEHLTSSFFKSDDLAAEVEQEEKLHRLNQAAALYLNSCLEKLGHRDPASFSGHYRHFFNWMKKFQYSAANHELIGRLTESEQRSILGSLRDMGLEGELVWRVCPRLPEIVTGQINPLTVMTEDDMMYRLYSDDASTRCYGHISRYLQHATFKNPNMTILELGGGTGAATLPVLQSLGSKGVLPINRYDFTDVSAAYFERTGDRLQEWKNYLEFKLLDVRGDFVQQGFEEGSYDVIIASNVVHVATYINSTLSQIRRLLKPGGRLMMLEITRVLPFYNTCVGMLEGWWEGNVPLAFFALLNRASF
jgi:ubiquinone/menaquinone biosynthesis C-methylase UbiE